MANNHGMAKMLSVMKAMAQIMRAMPLQLNICCAMQCEMK
jgi:hypothetical protein